MELIFTSDLHGSRDHFEGLLDVLEQWGGEVLVLGGDMHPDGDRGMPYQSVCEFVRGYVKEFLERARSVRAGLEVVGVLGNHDWSFVEEEYARLEEQGLIVLLGPEKVHRVGEWSFVGLSHCPPAPYWIKDYERQDLADDEPSDFGGYVWSKEQERLLPVVGREFFANHESLEQMLAGAPKVKNRLILVSHAPPSDSHVDLLKGGLHVGSRAVRRYIERVRPVVSFHGHIHESPRESGHVCEVIGGCLCVNAGQEHDRLCAVRWDSERAGEVEHTLGYRP